MTKKTKRKAKKKTATNDTHDTEVEAYAFIRRELGQLSWDCRNPSKAAQGEVWTQNQCFSDPDIKQWLDKKKPENIVKVDATHLWVIESKSKRNEIDAALDEAENYYASRLNQSKMWHVSLISGVAGNDADGYTIRNRFEETGKFKPILLNDQEMTGLISPDTARRVLSVGSASLKDIIVDQAYFMRKADRINEILHIGAVPINERAKVMAALLLSTLEGDLPDLNADPTLLVKYINARAEHALTSHGKAEFSDYVRLSLPTTLDNHAKYKKALVETLKELYNLNIKSAMNSGTDVLGQFYEVFLKYGNWAERMGIVLTPRHITRFAAEVLDVGLNDVVLDPTCGTGGFLVGAFDYVKATAQKHQMDQFRRHSIYGIDQQAPLACLAILNMIFRGDGRDKIIDGDCFAKWVTGTQTNGHVGLPAKYLSKKPPKELNVVTKVLMNPPFHIETSDEYEYKFVQQALDQMVDGGILFSILPMAAMFEQGEERDWRENRLIKENTLLSVISLSPELFYPQAAVYPIAIIVKKGMPHPPNQNVLWVRAIHDGLTKKKAKRLPNPKEPNDLKTVLPVMRAFVHNSTFPVESLPAFIKASPLDLSDPLLEFIPEAHLDSQLTTESDIKRAVDKLTRETVSYLIRTDRV